MSECDVCLGDFDGESADVWIAKIVRSRKIWKCDECEKDILQGQQYERIKMMYEGEWSEWHICMLCREIHVQFACGEGRAIGNFWEDMKELVFPDLKMSSKCFVGLSVAAKSEVIEQWQRWKCLKAGRTGRLREVNEGDERRANEG